VTAKPIVPREQANHDVDAAVDYYLKEAGGRIALDFIDALERAYRHISRHPASGSTHYSVELSLAGLRTWPVRRFPHIVFYVEAPDEVDVWRVLHGPRDIPEWMRETVRNASRSAGKGG
jgi:toxin ParE1/3/4